MAAKNRPSKSGSEDEKKNLINKFSFIKRHKRGRTWKEEVKKSL